MLASADFDSLKYFKALGLDRFVEDPQFESMQSIIDNGKGKELFWALTEQFKEKTADEWDAILTEADIVHQKLMHYSELATSEQAWANGYLAKVKFPNGKEYVEVNSPVKFFGCEQVDTQPAGNIGDNTSEVLAQHGYSADQIAEMLASGAVAGK